jgi:hypothetical protein
VRLSEAIRLGSMLKPQTFGVFSDDEGTCALGAANEARGRCADDSDVLTEAYELSARVCPVADCTAFVQGEDNIIPHLNDTHRWTRERIADWVQTIEDAQATPIDTLEAVEVAK